MSYHARVVNLDDNGDGTAGFAGGRYAGIRLHDLTGAGTYEVTDFGGTIDSGTLVGPDFFHRLAYGNEVLFGGKVEVAAANASAATVYFRF